MKSHLEIYYFIRIIRDQLHLSPDQTRMIIASHFQVPKMTNVEFERLVQIYNQYPPDNAHFVQFLREKHYKNAYICELLQITNATVNYHLGKKIKKDYVNGIAEQYVRNIKNHVLHSIEF